MALGKRGQSGAARQHECAFARPQPFPGVLFCFSWTKWVLRAIPSAIVQKIRVKTYLGLETVDRERAAANERLDLFVTLGLQVLCGRHGRGKSAAANCRSAHGVAHGGAGKRGASNAVHGGRDEKTAGAPSVPAASRPLLACVCTMRALCKIEFRRRLALRFPATGSALHRLERAPGSPGGAHMSKKRPEMRHVT